MCPTKMERSLSFRSAPIRQCAEPIATLDPLVNIYSSPVYVDGTLYVATQNTLYAIDAAQGPPRQRANGLLAAVARRET